MEEDDICDECGGQLDREYHNRACLQCGSLQNSSTLYVNSECAADTDDFSHILFDNHIGRLRIGNCVATGENSCIKNFQKYSRWSQCCTYRTQMLCKGFDKLDQLRYDTLLPNSLISNARKLYARVTSLPDFNRKHRSCLLASVVHAASRQMDIAIDDHYLCKFFGLIKAKTMHRLSEKIQQQCISQHGYSPIQNVSNLIVKVVSKSKLDKHVCSNALRLWQDMQHKPFVDKFRPTSIATACVAATAPSSITKKYLAESSGISMVTLSSCMRYFTKSQLDK